VLRKAIGQLLKQRNEWQGAITQLKLARDLQPADKETRLALIECYDRLEQPAAATAELLALVTYSRHDLPLFEQLANRLESDQAQAERAATSIIEAGPTEAENHAALAELRQRQDRWNEAIPHWKEVAELRRLEPTGLLKLAEAQMHEKQFPAARETLQKLRRTEWPSRFGSIDDQVRHLEGQFSTP
jgi:hypothetical protein